MSDERAHGSTEAISNTYSMNYDDLDDRIEGEENEPQNGNEQDENEIKSMTFTLCIITAHTIFFLFNLSFIW